jgi:hypothetical protein
MAAQKRDNNTNLVCVSVRWSNDQQTLFAANRIGS